MEGQLIYIELYLSRAVIEKSQVAHHVLMKQNKASWNEEKNLDHPSDNISDRFKI
jgi:hypothetical protein